MTKDILPQSYNVKIQGQGIWVTLGRHHLLHFPLLLPCHVLHTEMGNVRGSESSKKGDPEERRAITFHDNHVGDGRLASLICLQVNSYQLDIPSLCRYF